MLGRLVSVMSTSPSRISFERAALSTLPQYFGVPDVFFFDDFFDDDFFVIDEEREWHCVTQNKGYVNLPDFKCGMFLPHLKSGNFLPDFHFSI